MAKARIIRVFISSTFRDMHKERDELVKRTFPVLRKLCEKRGAIWGDVDLRWGVTDEQKAEGKVLPICLEEIHRCRPYFIGILGERYGWVPDTIPEDLIFREPWLRQYRNHSVTDLEIHHGVLLNPNRKGNAFFYFRDPAFVHALPEATRADCVEGPTPEEVDRYGLAEAERRADDRRKKLEILKAKIRISGTPVRENYSNPEELAALVLADLTAVIEKQFPTFQHDQLVQEEIEHQAFAEKRAQVYIRRDSYIQRLNRHAGGDGPPLLVLGEPGSGKSALLSHWAISYGESHPETLLLTHFIGSTPASTDWAGMLRRVLGEFRKKLNLQLEIPDTTRELPVAFKNGLSRVAAKGKIVLILDALNQLEDHDGALDLVWLPSVVPKNIRLILSTLAGRPLVEIERRQWPKLRIEPLDPAERRRLIAEYLKEQGRSLSDAVTARIVGRQATANPLYLRVLLDELKAYGGYALHQRIDRYLEAETVSELFSRVLKRYEEDYNRDRPGLVKDAMTAIWAARRGLSEAELFELLGNGAPLPQAYWLPLFLAADTSFVNPSGRIGFAHDFMRQAVEQRYLPSRDLQKAAHLKLAGYFRMRGLSNRKLDELPWQLAEAESWNSLYDLLKDIRFLDALMRFSRPEMLSIWARVENHSALRRIDAYVGILSSPPASDMVLGLDAVAGALEAVGYHRETLRLRQWLYEYLTNAGDDKNLLILLGNIALTVKRLGDPHQALNLYRAQLNLCRDPDDIQRCLGNMGVAFRATGNLHSAASHFQRQEKIARSHGLQGGLALALSGQGLVLKDLNELDRAEGLQIMAEREARFDGNLLLVAQICGMRAEIHRHRNQFEEAMNLHREQERVCLELGDVDELAQSLAGQALVYAEQKEFDRAFECWSRVEEHARKSGHTAQLAMTLANRAAAMAKSGNPMDAKRLFEEAAKLWRDVGYAAGLAIALANQALILCGNPQTSHDDQAEVWRLAAEAFRLVRRNGLQAIEQRFDLLFRQVRAQLDDGDRDK